MTIKVSRLPYDPGPAAWNELLPKGPVYPILERTETADVLIIGGGFAGLSSARRLKQLVPNLKAVLLEARQIAEGPAGRNSGFMIDLPHKLGSKDYASDQDIDHQQTRLNREAIAFAENTASELGMSKEAFIISGKTNAAATERGTKHNQNYAAHLTQMSEDHELLDAKAMRELCGSSYYETGLFTPGTAMLQPALYARDLAAGVSRSGVRIYENSPVISLERAGSGWLAKTPSGAVSAKKVILATNGHVESFGFYEKRLMHVYLYASMTRALAADELKLLGGEQRWGFTPADPMGTTVRKISGTGGNRIVVRNRFTWAPTRNVSKSKLASIAQVHDKSFVARFPKLKDVEMQYRWGGLLCLSRNTVPAFGELEQGLYAACCQNGLGTAMGTISGKLIVDLICGENSVSLDFLQSQAEPKRLPPEPFASIGANATLRWGELRAGKEL